MSIQTELTRITNAKAAIKAAVEGKGVTVPDGTLLDGMAALIESIEAGGGAGELFHTEITPATSGEVLTLEVGEKGERIAAMIVSAKVGSVFEYDKNYGVMYIGTINTREISRDPKVYNIIVYRNGYSVQPENASSAQHNNSTPSGDQVYSVYTIWNSTTVKPRVKFYITNGAESKYGLLVGKTYDIWVIKAG